MPYFAAPTRRYAQQYFVRLCVCFCMIAVTSLDLSVAADGWKTVEGQDQIDSVLAEVIAGSDANFAAITHGTFAYESKGTRTGPRTAPFLDQISDPMIRVTTEKNYKRTQTWTQSWRSWWDGTQLRLDQTAPLDQTQHAVVGAEDAVVFVAPWLGTENQYDPKDYVAAR